MSFFKRNLHSFKIAFLPLLILTVISSLIEQYTTERIQSILSSHDGLRPILYIFILISIVASILFPTLIMSFGILSFSLFSVDSVDSANSAAPANQTARSQGFVAQIMHLAQESCRFFEQLIIESLRAWGSTLMWGFFLLIPAFWRYLQMSFVPFVVLTDKAYNSGQVDALQRSAQVLNKNIFKTLAILFVFHLFLPVLMTVLFDKYSSFKESPLTATFLSAVEVYFAMISIQLLFNIFKNSKTPSPEMIESPQ